LIRELSFKGSALVPAAIAGLGWARDELARGNAAGGWFAKRGVALVRCSTNIARGKKLQEFGRFVFSEKYVESLIEFQAARERNAHNVEAI
jgi:hypothetical protein